MHQENIVRYNMADSKIDYYSIIEIPQELIDKIEKMQKRPARMNEDLIRAFIVKYRSNYTVAQMADALDVSLTRIRYITTKLKSEGLLK